MKILFVNIPYTGHIIPTLGLAEELIRRGHKVSYILSEDWRSKIEAIGADFIPYNEKMKTSDEIEKLCYLTAYITGLEVGKGYELLIYEAWFFLGEALGAKLNIPTIKLFTTFALNKNVAHDLICESNNLKVFLDEEIRIWHTKHLVREIEIKENDFLDEMIYNIPDMNIVFTSKWFQVDAESFDKRYNFVGASISMNETSSFIETQISDSNPIIYISLGTIYNKQLNFYKACIHEFANKNYNVIISVGSKYSIKSFGKLPKNIYVFPYVPQKEILKKTLLFITHGGMNSINEALYYGVPMIVIPQDADQPFNARRVKEMNLGTCIQIDDILNNLYLTVEKTINDRKISKNVQYAQKQLQNAGGIKKAADLIEGCLSC
ncbi:glycosyltransferase [Clostridiaceae bacterium M8S5]|nr:glycosyltransferase [Clostridiaceae bacterium M8S5]